MRERPILFSGPMVRALLNGTKTMTRRVVKGLKPEIAKAMDLNRGLPLVLDENGYGGLLNDGPSFVFGIPLPRCPYGAPGDRLWVRETWGYDFAAVHSKLDADGPFVYRADGDSADRTLEGRWRSPIHMPRWASRLTLTLTDVRVERVQDVSTHDLEAEGISIVSNDAGARNEYRELWDSLNAARGYGWDVNPWVWVLTFEVVRV